MTNGVSVIVTFSKNFDIGWTPNNAQWVFHTEGGDVTPIDAVLNTVDSIAMSFDEYPPDPIIDVQPLTVNAVLFDDATVLANTDPFPVTEL